MIQQALATSDYIPMSLKTIQKSTTDFRHPLAFFSFFPWKRSPPKQPKENQHLVLIGGGHAHVQVIKAFNKASRPPNLKVTLIDVQKSASYSGMVPGCVSGIYQPEDTLLHLEPLAKWAGIEFVNDKVVDIDLENKQIFTKHNQQGFSFDAISIDIGSTSRGLWETKGAKEFTEPTRPIADLVHRLEQATKELQSKTSSTAPVDVVVIGGGAAGLELSMSIHGRWEPIVGKENICVTVLDSGSKLWPHESIANQQALQQVLQERNIQVRHDCLVKEVKPNSVCLDDGVVIPFTHCVWATGAGAHNLAFHLRDHRGLAASNHGWIRVNQYLQSLSHPFVFAAGDCCTMEWSTDNNNLNSYATKSSPPKAGVYAVRSGPILIENISKS